jgi:hypothetical protein
MHTAEVTSAQSEILHYLYRGDLNVSDDDECRNCAASQSDDNAYVRKHVRKITPRRASLTRTSDDTALGVIRDTHTVLLRTQDAGGVNACAHTHSLFLNATGPLTRVSRGAHLAKLVKSWTLPGRHWEVILLGHAPLAHLPAVISAANGSCSLLGSALTLAGNGVRTQREAFNDLVAPYARAEPHVKELMCNLALAWRQPLPALLDAAADISTRARTSKAVWEQAVDIKKCLENKSEEKAWRRIIQPIRVSLCVTEPTTTRDPRFDALLAALTEYWLGKDSLPIPEWIDTPTRFLPEPWDVEPLVALKAEARSQTPPAFLRHGIYLAWSEIASL